MMRRLQRVFLVVCFLGAAHPLVAAEGALDAISSDVGLIIRVKSPNATIGKVADFVNRIVPGVGDQVRAQADGIGLAISNPTLAGVDKDSDWWMAIYPRGGEAEPAFVFVIPGSDVKAMKEGLQESFKFIEHGKFGVYSDDADISEKTAALLKGTGKSVAASIDKDSMALIDKGDISIFINVASIYTTYKDQITEARERMTQTLENVPTELPGTPGVNPKTMADVALQVINALIQGLEDTKSCTIAGMISNEGLAFEDLIRVTDGSKTDKLLQKSPPNPLSSLATLPSGGLGYFGLHGELSDLMQFGLRMLGGVIDQKDNKEFQEAMAELQKLKYGAIVSSFGLGSVEEGALRSVGLTEISDPAKLRSLMGALMKAVGTVETGGMKQTYSLKPDAEKHGQNSVDLLTVKVEPAEGSDPAAGDMLERFMKAMYGPEGMITRTVYLKDKVVQANGGGKEALDKALAALDKNSEAVGSAAHFQQARGRLAEKANVVVLFDLPGTAAKVIELLIESGTVAVPLSPEAIKGLDLKPSFLGLSMATETQGLRVKTSIPTEQAQGVAKIVLLVLGTLQGAGN
jgi:hypothetical protein